MRMRRFAVLPDIDVCFHDPAGIVKVTAVQARPMIDVFSDHAETTDRRAMAFAAAGNARSSSLMFSAVQIGLLFAEIDHDGGAPGVAFRNVRCDEIAHGVVCAATAQSGSQKDERSAGAEPICDFFKLRETLHDGASGFATHRDRSLERLCGGVYFAQQRSRSGSRRSYSCAPVRSARWLGLVATGAQNFAVKRPADIRRVLRASTRRQSRDVLPPMRNGTRTISRERSAVERPETDCAQIAASRPARSGANARAN